MRRSDIKVLVITGFGLNCERETAAACKLVGATPELVHLNDVVAEGVIDKYQMLCFIGGFSFGDHLGSGTVFANRVKMRLHDQLEKFVGDGKLVIGICNGFQTLTRLGMVPALNGNYFEQSVALAHNDSGVFRDDWCTLKADQQSPCVFTRGIDTIRLPLRHGEGKFVADDRILSELEEKHLAVLKYVDGSGRNATEFPDNPNGSLNSIAGICDPTGKIFGLMPHPEAFLSPYNSPDWTRNGVKDEGDGVAIFRNAVDYIQDNF